MSAAQGWSQVSHAALLAARAPVNVPYMLLGHRHVSGAQGSTPLLTNYFDREKKRMPLARLAEAILSSAPPTLRCRNLERWRVQLITTLHVTMLHVYRVCAAITGKAAAGRLPWIQFSLVPSSSLSRGAGAVRSRGGGGRRATAAVDQLGRPSLVGGAGRLPACQAASYVRLDDSVPGFGVRGAGRRAGGAALSGPPPAPFSQPGDTAQAAAQALPISCKQLKAM